jgi:hypothetical protein
MESLECENCHDHRDVMIDVTRAAEGGMLRELWCLVCVNQETQNQLRDKNEKH